MSVSPSSQPAAASAPPVSGQRLNGQTPINGWLGLVLAIVIIPALYGYMQSGLNSAWKAVPQAEPAPAAV